MSPTFISVYVFILSLSPISLSVLCSLTLYVCLYVCFCRFFSVCLSAKRYDTKNIFISLSLSLCVCVFVCVSFVSFQYVSVGLSAV